jgi:hypothetical protein
MLVPVYVEADTLPIEDRPAIAVLHKLFPKGQLSNPQQFGLMRSYPVMSWRISATLRTNHTKPANCEVLATATSRDSTSQLVRRYIVEVEGVLALLRVVKAQKGCGYAEVVLLDNVAVTDSDQAMWRADLEAVLNNWKF